jgi:tRNA U34 2-thiouridine synthase MnmA/TrmU
MKPSKSKVLILLSGGLDSRLVVKLVEEQVTKKNITALIFKLPFGSKYSKDLQETEKFCKQQDIKCRLIDVTTGKLLQEYLKLLKNPKHGYGTACNPCIDCHVWMLKKAKQYAEKNKIEIIATGEVLGERPMSQHKKALEIIEQESGLQGRLLRPLSAKLLPATEAEQSGKIDRSKLLDIQGRSRKMQMRLAEKYKISYPSPGGGCLLCEPEFAEKLKPLLKGKVKDIDIALLKVGRHFENSNIILGKNEQENIELETIQKKYKQGILLVPEEPGPTAFIKNKKYEKKAKTLIQEYSKHKITKIKEIKN